MLLGALLGIAAAGSAVIATAAMTTKDKDKIIQPTINNINNINNSFNKTVKTCTSNSTETSVKDSYTTQQSAEVDHDKIIDELYARYKIDKSTDDLNELLERLNNLK